ncbi:MAG: protein-glutamate O-methyltransferase [Dehalococcoidia bacterium]|nr:protein-glutamate O-methyltransferase [Dehalococcoidia bacterium]
MIPIGLDVAGAKAGMVGPAAPQRSAASFGDQKDALPRLSDETFARLARIVRAETGIVLGPSKRNMVVSRLARRLRHLGLTDFADYCRLLESAEGATERRVLTSAITTNVTSFFRESRHFETLAGLVPEFAARARRGERIRIWSAGCATGQEPYSIAVTLLDRWPDAPRYDVRILGTDIDPEAVAAARRGVYEARLVGDAPPMLRRHLVPGPEPGSFALGEEPRKLVRFEELNLLGPWPFRGRFDVIFCRNVVIYFDAASRLRLWERFAERLMPGGWLFVGHSERIDASLEDLLIPAGITQYRRSGVPSAPQGPGGEPRRSPRAGTDGGTGNVRSIF